MGKIMVKQAVVITTIPNNSAFYHFYHIIVLWSCGRRQRHRRMTVTCILMRLSALFMSHLWCPKINFHPSMYARVTSDIGSTVMVCYTLFMLSIDSATLFLPCNTMLARYILLSCVCLCQTDFDCVCVSVNAGIVSKLLNLGTCKPCHTIAQGL